MMVIFQEQEESQFKERELEEEVDFLLPYLAKLGNPDKLTYAQASLVRKQCLESFKQLLLARANDIQQKFEKVVTNKFMKLLFIIFS